MISTPFTRDPARKKMTPSSGFRPLTTLFQQLRNLKCHLSPPSCSWIGRERWRAVDSSIRPTSVKSVNFWTGHGVNRIEPSPPLQNIGTLRSEGGDGDGSVNDTEKVNSRSFNLHRVYSRSLILTNVSEPS